MPKDKRLRVTMQDQARLIAWAEPHMGVEAGKMPSDTIALGIIDTITGEIEAVVALNAFYNDYASLHVASNGRRRWLSRSILTVIFSYAFDFLELKRLNFMVSAANVPVQVLALKLGLRIEGVARCAAIDGQDGVLFGMLSEECPWRRSRDSGEKRTEA